MNRFLTFALLAATLTTTGCYRTVEGQAYWQERGPITAFDGSEQLVTVACRAGRTVIVTPTHERVIDREVEAVRLQRTNIRTIERSADGMLLYEVIYALGDDYEVIDISTDTLASITLSSLSR